MTDRVVSAFQKLIEDRAPESRDTWGKDQDVTVVETAEGQPVFANTVTPPRTSTVDHGDTVTCFFCGGGGAIATPLSDSSFRHCNAILSFQQDFCRHFDALFEDGNSGRNYSYSSWLERCTELAVRPTVNYRTYVNLLAFACTNARIEHE